MPALALARSFRLLRIFISQPHEANLKALLIVRGPTPEIEGFPDTRSRPVANPAFPSAARSFLVSWSSGRPSEARQSAGCHSWLYSSGVISDWIIPQIVTAEAKRRFVSEKPHSQSHCTFAYSALASFRMGMSASFRRVSR